MAYQVFCAPTRQLGRLPWEAWGLANVQLQDLRESAAWRAYADGEELVIEHPWGVPVAVYWWELEPGVVLLSDNLTAFARLPAVRALGLDAVRLGELAREARASDGTRTVYRAVRSLPAGHELRLGAHETRARAMSAPSSLPRVGSALQQLSASIEWAVARAIGGAEKVAVMGGGGVDSSALFAAAQRQVGSRRASLIALCFDGEDSDLPYLDMLEQSLGVRASRLEPGQTHGLWPEAFIMDAQPYLWPTGAWELCSARQAKMLGAKVFLTGAGGDDVFDPWWPQGRFSRRWSADERVNAFYTHRLRAMSMHSRAQLQFASGISVREPYFDMELVCAAAGMSAAELMLGGQSRGLLRQSMKGAVPDAICERRSKADFTEALIAGVYESPSWPLVRELGRAELLSAHGMTYVRTFRELFRRLDDDPRQGELWAALWPALAVEYFLRHWSAQTNP